MNINLKTILTRLKQELTNLYGELTSQRLRYRLQHLTLFGSQARGDAEPGSDIDVTDYTRKWLGSKLPPSHH